MTGGLHITAHAIARYQERVANLSDDEVRAKLSTPFIRIAAEFGASAVILTTGHHAVICDMTVVTVRPLLRWKPRKPRRIEEDT